MATYELIEHIEVGSGGAASIEFTSIPADYDDLLLVASLRFARAVISTPVKLLLNGTDFTARNLYGDSNTTGSQTVTADYIGWSPAANSTSNTFGNLQIYIPNYTASGAKSFSADVVDENNGNAFQAIDAGLTTTTTAIVTLELSDQAAASSAVQYSSATLYGIRKYDTAGSPKATGGIISFDSANNKWVHTFTASGTFTPTEDITCEYLVVAGGGGGGAANRGGGGGAGGYRSSVSGESSGGGSSAESPLSLETGNSYTVTIGGGGATQATTSANTAAGGQNGSDSVFATVTSLGGGGGAASDTSGFDRDPKSGGSGGGGWYPAKPGAAGTSGQGFVGGNGGNSVPYGGGGGGAGEAGHAFNDATNPCGGGDGVASSITGTSVYRAGGGSSSNFVEASSYPGGQGGGGIGDNRTAAVAGTPPANGGTNLGGGGGASGNGGSGIVIVRYSA